MYPKKIIILQHNGGRLANQLWNFASIYAYSLEKKYECRNYSFFEYGHYFERIKTDNLLVDVLFFRTFEALEYIFPFKVARKIARILYGSYVRSMEFFHKDEMIRYGDNNQNPYYLPPTRQSIGSLKMLEENNDIGKVYFYGWLFRDPAGLEKYRDRVVAYFTPGERYLKNANEQIRKLRSEYNRIIGVHIRKGDYKSWNGGNFSIDEKRFREVLDEYVRHFTVDPGKTAFLFFSDGRVDLSTFNGLHTFSPYNRYDVGDLYELSMCDVIIGSDSTFGAFASYYGKIPFIVATNDAMQWDYYNDKRSYFENKFSKVVHY
jgi:hypothetical protein